MSTKRDFTHREAADYRRARKIRKKRRGPPVTENPMASELAPYKVTPPAHIRVPPIQNAAKRCFELAGVFCLEHSKDAVLVHGIVNGKIAHNIAHAWCEIDGLVYEGTCKGLFDAEAYYRVMRADPIRKMEAHEIKALIDASAWGPCLELLRAVEGKPPFHRRAV